MVKVKICGVASVRDARAAVLAGASAIGLNFYPPSPRFVTGEQAEAIVAALPREVCRVGVFVDAPRGHVEELAVRLSLDAVQFHGNETAEYCRGWKQKTIKAIRVRDPDWPARASGYPVDFILADAYVEGLIGGTGRTIRWDLLRGADGSRLILAGGLTPENVAEAVRQVRPFAVDVASGVEKKPGVKDAERMKRFVTNAQSA